MRRLMSAIRDKAELPGRRPNRAASRAVDDAAISGPVNVVSPGILRQGEFAKALGHALHRPALTPTPGFAIKLMLGEGAQIITQGQHAVPRAALDAGYDFRFTTAAVALADLFGESD